MALMPAATPSFPRDCVPTGQSIFLFAPKLLANSGLMAVSAC